MSTEKIPFTYNGETLSITTTWSKMEVVVETPGGDLNAQWEEGEGFFNMRGMGGLDDFDGDVVDLLHAADRALDQHVKTCQD